MAKEGKKIMIKIRADLNALTLDRSRVQLSGELLEEDMEAGLRVLLYEPDDFEVEATLEKIYTKHGTVIWYGIADWDTFKYLDE